MIAVAASIAAISLSAVARAYTYIIEIKRTTGKKKISHCRGYTNF
jgi:hypothetical protein